MELVYDKGNFVRLRTRLPGRDKTSSRYASRHAEACRTVSAEGERLADDGQPREPVSDFAGGAPDDKSASKKPFLFNGSIRPLRLVEDMILPVAHFRLFHRNVAHRDSLAVHRRF